MTSAMEARFKRYESCADQTLTRRAPVIGRLDGKAFHTLTRGLEKPFDRDFFYAMQHAAVGACREMQGCKLVYWQSDEISFLLIDYETIQTEPWFDYRLNKMVSIAASMASVAFTSYHGKPGYFDGRFFNVPDNDVCNYFVFRQRDAERNSLNSLAQSMFSQKELHGKNSEDIHEMLHLRGVNWNDLPAHQKRGAVMYRDNNQDCWVTPKETPEFSKDRQFVEQFLPRVLA